MEKAIFITDIGQLSREGREYQRLYFGNEFCQCLIPSRDDVLRAYETACHLGWGFTFVTPYVTDEGMKKLRPILEDIVKRMPDAEVVASDWGVLRLLRKELGCVHCVAGRLLMHQSKSLLHFKEMSRLLAEELKCWKVATTELGDFAEEMSEYGLGRVELDNAFQGVERPDKAMKASLYFPYICVSTTRICPHVSLISKRKMIGIDECSKECGDGGFRLSSDRFSRSHILRWNAYFLENWELPGDMEGLNIDRLVYQPFLGTERRG